MAIPNSSYITDILKIKNSVHRQKLQLKALDVVLFGVHDATTLKDVAIAVLTASFVGLAVLFVSHRKKSHQQLEDLTAQLGELNTMERNFGEESDQNVEQVSCLNCNEIQRTTDIIIMLLVTNQAERNGAPTRCQVQLRSLFYVNRPSTFAQNNIRKRTLLFAYEKSTMSG